MGRGNKRAEGTEGGGEGGEGMACRSRQSPKGAGQRHSPEPHAAAHRRREEAGDDRHGHGAHGCTPVVGAPNPRANPTAAGGARMEPSSSWRT